MTWIGAAQDLLDTATAVTLTTPPARTFVAPGGIFARDCRLLAVYADRVVASPLGLSDLPGQGCAVAPVLGLNLVFVADCVPAPSDSGQAPPATAVQAWTEDFLTDSEALWNAVADAVLAGILGECDSVSVDEATFAGPLGGVAEFSIPIRVLPS